MKLSSVCLLALVLLFLCPYVNAQMDIRQNQQIDLLLRQVANKQPGLTIFARPEQYVNMAVVNSLTKTITWFTCHGSAFDSARFTLGEFNQLSDGLLDPFAFFQKRSFQVIKRLNLVDLQFRLRGNGALSDSSVNTIVCKMPGSESATTALQKIVLIESALRHLYLALDIFNCRMSAISQTKNNQHLSMQVFPGSMLSKPDSIEYFNRDPASAIIRIVLRRSTVCRMYIYGMNGVLLDSVPLKAAKFANLLQEMQDVFVLYRGWLAVRWEQTNNLRQAYMDKLHRVTSGLFTTASWSSDEQQLSHIIASLEYTQASIETKIQQTVVPQPGYAAQYIAKRLDAEQPQISYLPGLGFTINVNYTRRQKIYELTEQRGNVVAVVSDVRKDNDFSGDGVIDTYSADIANSNDYYSFGMLQPGRIFNANNNYRYGYNGKENDDNVKGYGNQQDYGMRMYDPRIGKFLSIDPLIKDYPELTPYQFASNRPIDGIDLDGEEYLKKPNSKATALIVVGRAAGTDAFPFPGFLKAALANPYLDVMKAGNIAEINHYLSEVNIQYRNVIFADHGSAGESSQVLTNSPTDYGYLSRYDLKKEASEYEHFGTKIKPGGSIILLGCFTAAPNMGGRDFISQMSATTGRNVFANQGESMIEMSRAFNSRPIGGLPHPPAPSSPLPSFYYTSITNARQWSVARPNGQITDIGSIGINEKGAVTSGPVLPPTTEYNKLPTWREYLNWTKPKE